MDVLGLPPTDRRPATGGAALRPVNPRLVRRAGPARRALALAGLVSLLDALLLVLAAAVLADIVATVVLDRVDVADVAPHLLALLGLLGSRAILGWLALALPQRAAAAVKLELRTEIMQAAMSLRRSGEVPTGEVAAIAGRGLDALDPYFARYVPELIRAATVPVAVLVALLSQDLSAGLIVAFTLPLIPLFGALIGAYTEHRTRRQWRTLAVLSHHFLDVVRGLPTLRVFGRAAAQAKTIANVTEQHRTATMATLRIALLSALVLELAATVSVALVAVSVGLRLVNGGLDLRTALFLLILAPEAYLPLRRAAAEFHAASGGLAAAERAFVVIDHAGEPVRADAPAPDPRRFPLLADELVIRYPDRDGAVLDRLSVRIPPGQVTAIVGPSGCGKSTLLRVFLGLRTPDAGRVRIGETSLTAIDPAAWHRRCAWLPQEPHLVSASIADNIRLGRPDATDQDVQAAARQAGAHEFIATLPAGYDTVLAEGGSGLSAGQRQRLALARIFLRTDASLVLLDEPTAHLDAATEEAVGAAVRDFASDRTVVVVTHRPTLLGLADHVVDMTPHTSPGAAIPQPAAAVVKP